MFVIPKICLFNAWFQYSFGRSLFTSIKSTKMNSSLITYSSWVIPGGWQHVLLPGAGAGKVPLTVYVLLALCDWLQHPSCVPPIDLLPRPDVSLGHHLHQPLIRADQWEASIMIVDQWEANIKSMRCDEKRLLPDDVTSVPHTWVIYQWEGGEEASAAES